MQIGQRVKTPSGLLGTVISLFETANYITCEVEFDCGGLMHYSSAALIQIMDGRCETDKSN